MAHKVRKILNRKWLNFGLVAIAMLLGEMLRWEWPLQAAWSLPPPSPKQERFFFSLPLDSPELAQGVLTVKVIGADLSDIRVGQEVKLYQMNSLEWKLIQTNRTGEDGRAHFTDLRKGIRYVAAIFIDNQEYRSTPFEGPTSGGLRLLFSRSNNPMLQGTPDSTIPAELPAGHPPLPQLLEKSPARMPSSKEISNQNFSSSGPPSANNPANKHRKNLGAALVTSLPGKALGIVEVHLLTGLTKQAATATKVTLMDADQRTDYYTDSSGKVPIELKSIKSSSVILHVIYDGLTYRSAAIPVPQSGGFHALFTVYKRTQSSARMTFGSGTHLVSQIGESSIGFMQMLVLVNKGDQLFDPGPEGFIFFSLPEGAERAELPDDIKDIIQLSADNTQLLLKSLFPPGPMTIRVFYEIPYKDSELDFRQKMHLAMAESIFSVVNYQRLRVFGPSSKAVLLAAASNRDNKAFSLLPAKAGAWLEFTLADLPCRQRNAAWIAIALASIIALWSIWGVKSGSLPVTEKLKSRKHELIAQLEQLEQAPIATDAKQQQIMILNELQNIWHQTNSRQE